MKTEPKERPIRFRGDMVRAIIDGRTTQTRRKIKPIKHPYGHMLTPDEVANEIIHETGAISSPYGKIGDRLWVREPFWQAGDWLQSHPEDDGYKVWSGSCRIFYSADGSPPNEPNRNSPNGLLHGRSAADPHNIWRSRPSIHMPRRASRILLEITGVRVERLNDISDADAWAEGVDMTDALSMPCAEGAVAAYSALWERINGKGSWDLNPWVWVIEFKVLEIKR